jgi:hypothetical protein
MSAREEARQIGPPSEVQRLRDALVRCLEIAEFEYGFGGEEYALSQIIEVIKDALDGQQS